MATLHPSTVIPGPCYIIKIKQSRREYDGDDLIYVVGYKGKGNFGFGRFKTLCEETNGMFCLATKLNEGKSITWEECKEEVEDLPPKGSPFLLIERAYTLAEVGVIAYNQNIFTNPQGLKSLSRLTKPPKSCTVVKVKQENKSEQPIVHLSLAQVHQQAQQLRNIQNTAGLPNLGEYSQAGVQLTNGNGMTVPEASEYVTVVESDDDDGQVSSGMKNDVGGVREDGSGLDNIVEERSKESWKEIALTATARANGLDEEKKLLEDRVGILSAKLKVSEEQSVKYMAQLDIKEAAFKIVTDEISDKVVAKMTTKLEPLTDVKKAAVETLALVKTQALPMGRLPKILNDINSRMESNFDAVSEGVTRIQDALDTFGITEGEESVDIPEAVRYVFDVTKQHAQSFGTPVRDEQVPDICFYQAHNIENVVLVCKCGCDFEVTGAFHAQEGEHEEGKLVEEVPAVVALGTGSGETRNGKETDLPLSSPGQRFSENPPTPVLKRSGDGFEPVNPKKHRRNRSAKTKHSNHAGQLVSMKSDPTVKGAPAASYERSAGVRDVPGSGRSRQSSPLDQPGPSHHMPRALFKPTGGNKNIKVWMNEPPPN